MSSYDIVDAIRNHQNFANKIRVEKNLEPSLFWVEVLHDEGDELQYERKIDNKIPISKA